MTPQAIQDAIRDLKQLGAAPLPVQSVRMRLLRNAYRLLHLWEIKSLGGLKMTTLMTAIELREYLEEKRLGEMLKAKERADEAEKREAIRLHAWAEKTLDEMIDHLKTGEPFVGENCDEIREAQAIVELAIALGYPAHVEMDEDRYCAIVEILPDEEL